MSPSPLILLCGPTASGKSTIALQLARRINATLVNADSMQVYQALNILTASPTAQDRTLCPHELYNHYNPLLPYSAALWAKDVTHTLRSSRGPHIVVGGTGLYFHTLLHGLAPLPSPHPALRARLFDDIQNNREKAYATLQSIDPDFARRIHLHDTHRLLRGLEIFEMTGQKPSMLLRSPHTPLATQPTLRLLLEPSKDDVKNNALQRFHAMLEGGVIDEVQAFLEDIGETRPAVTRAIGFKPIARYLSGTISRDILLEETQRETNAYIKRQYTWFAKYMENWHKLAIENTLEKTYLLVSEFLKTHDTNDH